MYAPATKEVTMAMLVCIHPYELATDREAFDEANKELAKNLRKIYPQKPVVIYYSGATSATLTANTVGVRFGVKPRKLAGMGITAEELWSLVAKRDGNRDVTIVIAPHLNEELLALGRVKTKGKTAPCPMNHGDVVELDTETGDVARKKVQ